ncbi:MAG: Uma2 family endonuclease [Oscillatoria sp. SIO1A7]|nr:Uma2 family endonuclease [Oscillatoria sp. SIO1A7]
MTSTLLSSRRSRQSLQSCIPLVGVSWRTYKSLMAEVGDGRPWRIAYDRGVLEIRMPLEEHEEPKELLGDIITAIADELEIEIRKLGSLTLEREDLSRAVEPDACFYIQNEERVRGRKIDLQTDPPPDIAIESDYTNSSLNKHGIYAALGVPEIWRYRRNTLEIYLLAGSEYSRSSQSLAFPFLPVLEVPSFLVQSQKIGQRAAVRQFRARIQEILSGETL